MKMTVMVCIMPAIMGCSAVKPADSGKNVVSCTGEDDSDCQARAWKQCNGPFKTIADDYTGHKMVPSSAVGNLRATKGYKITFQCEDRE